MKKTIFTGAGVAIVTPFANGKVNYEELGRLIDFQIEHSTDAIIICGTTGEASTMPDREHLDVIEYAVKKANKRVPVIAGAGSNDTAHGLELSRESQKMGADGLLIVTPYYNKANTNGLIQHFNAYADAVDIPIILYNVPSRTGVNITTEVLKEVSKADNIVGIKEASGNISHVADIAYRCPNIDIYSGNDDMIVPILSLGGKGVISVLSNVMPKETHDICQLFFDGKIKESASLQIKLMDLIQKLFIEVNPVPVKTALNLMGFAAGDLRLPLGKMDERNLDKLRTAMINCGIKVV